MLSDLIAVGSKIELWALEKAFPEKNGREARKVYYSTVCDIVSEDVMEIAMPMEQTRLILLPVDGEYNLVVYGQKNLYQSVVRVTDRYRSKNQYILVVELLSNLRKYQRREYYRFNCILEMGVRNLAEQEIKELDSNPPHPLNSELPLEEAVVVDISGGGLRFTSEHSYEPDSLILCNFLLEREKEEKRHEIVCRVLHVQKLENRSEVYEHRVQYYDINNDEREEIIKYIFEKERKSRKKGKGL